MATSTTTTTATSSGLGSLNFGSGADLDLDKYYSQLEAAEQTKLSAYDTQVSSVQTKLTAYSTMQSSLDALKSQAAALTTANLQKSATATTSAVAYIPKATDNTYSGTYDIQVNQLATTQSNASQKVSSATDVIGSGTITLQQGTGEAVTVDVSNGSLNNVRDAINKAKDSSGNKLNISAAVLTDDTGTSYLTISSTKTGKDSAFTVSASGTSGLTDVVSNMSVKRAATDAKFSVNGVDLETSSNIVTDAVPGLELTLSSVSTQPETTTLGVNTDEWVKSVTAFVTSYNSFLVTMNGLTKYSTSDDTSSGALVGDSGARSVRTQVKDLLSNKNLAALKQFGITAMDLSKASDKTPAGTLEINTAKLTKAITNNPTNLEEVFSGTDGKSGIMGQITDKIANFEDSKTGLLTTNTNTFNKKIDNITEQKTRATTASEARLKQYKESFSKLVAYKTKMDAQLESIKAQFEALKKSS